MENERNPDILLEEPDADRAEVRGYELPILIEVGFSEDSSGWSENDTETEAETETDEGLEDDRTPGNSTDDLVEEEAVAEEAIEEETIEEEESESNLSSGYSTSLHDEYPEDFDIHTKDLAPLVSYWRQSLSNICMKFKVPVNVSEHHIEVIFERKSILYELVHTEVNRYIGEFYMPCKPEECVWCLTGNTLHIHIVKEQHQMWNSLFREKIE